MLNGLAAELRTSPRPGGRSGDTRRCRWAGVLSTFALTLLPSLGLAQTASDVFACALPDRTFTEMNTVFAGFGWDAVQPSRSEIMRQLLFLGNVDELAPDTWTVTADWADDLAKHQLSEPYEIYALDDSAVLLQRYESGDFACFFVSDRELNGEFLKRFPSLGVRYVEERGFGWLDREDLRVSTAFISDPTSRLILFSEGRRTTATIFGKSAAEQEDQ